MDAIQKGIEYLLTNRRTDGMWTNFLTRTNGESADWVSSYVGLALLESGVKKEDLEQTAQAVLKRQKEEGGFSCNEKIIPDADSTAFAILFLSKFGQGYFEQLQKAKGFLLRHQNTDGSFSTYLEHNIREYHRIPEEMDVKGWCGGVADVTSSALQALSYNQKAVNFLKNSQENGSWRSYWWTSDVYATARSVLALEGIKDAQKGIIKNAQNWLKEQNTKVPFYQGLIIQALLVDNSPRIAKDRVYHLISTQKKDGSWENHPILRFPHPSNISPWKDSSNWREPSSDQHSFFTTATCIKSLERYNHS